MESSGYTCVARPCLQYPNTEIAKGDLAWVRTPGGNEESRHKGCKDQPGYWDEQPKSGLVSEEDDIDQLTYDLGNPHEC